MSKLIEEILNENNEPRNLEKFVTELDNLVKEYTKLGTTIDVYLRHFFSVELNTIKAPPDQKNKGIASSFMEGLVSLADKHHIIITLSPSDSYGSNIKRLQEFYKRFGFRSNLGRKADHRFSNSMIREPKGINKAFNELNRSYSLPETKFNE